MTRNELIERLVEAAIRMTETQYKSSGWVNACADVESIARQLKELQ